MSAAVDLSPLKQDSPSVCSVQVRPSSLGCLEEDLESKSSYATISFVQNSASPGRSDFSTAGAGNEDGDHRLSSEVPNSSEHAAKHEPTSKQASPVSSASFIISNDSGLSASHVDDCKTASASSMSSLNQHLCHKQHLPQRRQYIFSQGHNIINGLSYISEDELKSFQGNAPALESFLDRISASDIDNAANVDLCGSAGVERSGAPENCDDKSDIMMDTKIEDDDDWSDKDDHQIECAECCTIFCNLQSYMDHVCSGSQKMMSSSATGKQIQSFQRDAELSDSLCFVDAVNFHGNIVIGANGSAYVIDDSCLDNDVFSLLCETAVLNDNQPVAWREAWPSQISKVVFISHKTLYPAYCQSPERSENWPGSESYHVFDLTARDTADILHLLSSFTSLSRSFRQILMCFNCKLVFRRSESLLLHAVNHHSIAMTEENRALIAQHNISVISHVSGIDRQGKLSILYPMDTGHSSLPRTDDLHGSTRKKQADIMAQGDPPGMEGRPPLSKHVGAVLPSRFSDLRPALDIVSLSRQNCLSHGGNYGFGRTLSPRQHLSAAAESDSGNDGNPKSSLTSGSDGLVSRKHLKNQKTSADEPNGASTLGPSKSSSSSSVNPSSSSSSTSLLISDFLPSSSTSTTLSPTTIPTSGQSLASPTTSKSLLSSSSAASSSMQPFNLQMTNFVCTCEDHGQGRTPGADCIKCNMVHSLSPSLINHLTLTHSRNSCKTLKCPKCNWHYKYQETLEIHMKEKHPDSDTECSFCVGNQVHPRLARGETYSCGYKPYRCEICNYSTTTKGNLSIHMQSDKHINNVQDLTAGSVEMKMQSQQSPVSQQPALSSAGSNQNASSSSLEEALPKTLKPKLSFRCDVCSYETSVARNLRIHMTSEKHTHNLMIMSQTANNIQQDLALPHLSHVNQFLSVNQQEQAARLAAFSLSSALLSYEQTAMFMSTAYSPSLSRFETDKSMKENENDTFHYPKANKDATKMFQCCICNKYNSDSMNNIHNHIQYDRTKSGNSDAHICFTSGMYTCSLCCYKTNLKANFQLHCKTDKHLHKLQMVNHIMEGGPGNEWKLTRPNSPIQVCCNACSFYASSPQKMQLHLSTVQHESCAQLFRYLQMLDLRFPSPNSHKTRYYHCSLCSANVPTKSRLIMHSMTPRHLQKEQSFYQNRVSFYDVYFLKEISDGESVQFDDADDESKDNFEETDGSPDLANSSDANLLKVTATTAPLSARESASANIPGVPEAEVIEKSESVILESGDNSENAGVSSPLVLTTASTGLPPSADISVKNDTDFHSTSNKCDGSNKSSDSHAVADSSQTQCSKLSDQQSSRCVQCPLCGHEFRESAVLEYHIIKEHNVGLEGLQRLFSMVDLTSSSCPSAMKSSEVLILSLPPSSQADITTSATVSSLESSYSSPVTTCPPREITASHVPDGQQSITASSAVEEPTQASNTKSDLESLEMDKLRPEQNIEVSMPLAITEAPSSEIIDSIHHVQPAPSSSLSSSSSSSSSSSLPLASSGDSPRLEEVTSSHSPDSADHRKKGETICFIGEEREINLDNLEAEHQNLLKAGVDLAAQERMNKEYEDMFCCQTCSTSFSNIDHLFSHQNELGHLELKQTPRGPGYLCWKRGCNQYFKTASVLQIHFKEIHARKSSAELLSPQDLGLYKFKCEQCSFSFKSSDEIQRHALIHIMQFITQCNICSSRSNSVKQMRKHLKTGHMDLTASDMSAQLEYFEKNASLLSSTPADQQLISKILLTNSSICNKKEIPGDEEVVHDKKLLQNGMGQNVKRESIEQNMEENDSVLKRYKQALDEYLNSQPVAEEHYKKNERKFRCHFCKMAFTDKFFLFAHTKTSLHRRNEQMNHLNDPTRPYRCDVCKESYTTKGLLQAHYNSLSHLEKLSQQIQANGDSFFTSPHLTLPLLSPVANPASTTSCTTGNYSTFPDTTMAGSTSIKSYKCNICKVSYNNQASIDVHMRSVDHKTKAAKLGELIQSGQMDLNQAFIENSNSRSTSRQQAQIIADLIHQQASAQAASNVPASFFSLQALQDLNAVTQMALLGAIPPLPHHMLEPSTQAVLATTPNPQTEAFYSSLTAHSRKERNSLGNLRISNTHDVTNDKLSKISSNPDLSEKIVDNISKDADDSEPSTGQNAAHQSMTEDNGSGDRNSGNKEDELHPNFHAPIISRPRGFMGRFKPQLHRSLLENFGFECVMHFNEESTRMIQEEKFLEEKEEHSMENMDCEPSEDKETDRGKEDQKTKDQESNARKDEDKENIDLPELNRCHCNTCNRDFSNVWVLKNHEEEVHNHFVSSEIIEDFGQKFKEKWEKTLPKSIEQEPVQFSQQSSNPLTPSVTSTVDKIMTTDMPPPAAPQPQFSSNFDMSQLLPFMGMGLLPMHLPMNVVNLQGSLIPSLMLPTFDMSQSFPPHMPPQSVLESPGCINSHQAAIAAVAQNQKRARTRISDDQLKVLRQYFDINNSPTEEQVNKMADQTGLPQKVIKHWFRNTLFKERQRNKDSPYNFNNPPSTSIDLDEYDRTGKIPEIKVEPEEDSDKDPNSVPEIKNETPCTNDKNMEERNECSTLDSGSLKVDLTVKTEPLDEVKKDQESHSNMSSPSISSVPSTPTASAPATPTSAITSSSGVTTYPQAFTLDSYVANLARLEAPTFHSLSKRANRTRFTDYQIRTLQDYFERNAYPKDDDLEHLSKILGLSARVIVVWFQNARQKARKIYENQPPCDGLKDSATPFQKTPGMNYQCKKCSSVFLRYYELIKHQKNSCIGESNNNKLIPVASEDDSDFSYSNDECSPTDQQSNPASGNRDRDMQPCLKPQEQDLVSLTTVNKAPNVSLTQPPSSLQSPSSSIPSLKCDKCTLTFSRYDKLQEHQKSHSVAPALFPPFSPTSSFGMLQAPSQQEVSKTAFSIASMPVPSMPNSAASHQPSSSMTAPLSSLASVSPSAKRKTDSEDESGDQPRDKRLRTTILPEQLDYLYQQYQIDCNPSRKQLEQIASSVNLKKRVVQVWFQNTRARERKGHYRAHQQLINKRCPFCRALFRAKSALESHLATKHPEEMAKEDINIDLIPDAVIDSDDIPTSPAASSSLGPSSASDISKFLPSAASATVPNYMALMSSTNNFNLPLSGPVLDMICHSPLEDAFVKKYMNDLVSNMAVRQEHSVLPSHNRLSSSCATSTNKVQAHQTPSGLASLPRPFDAHNLMSTSHPPALSSSDDAPLDLSRPVKIASVDTSSAGTPSLSNHSTSLDLHERSMDDDYLRRVNSLDDSFSETLSEMADQEYMNDIGNSPPSPSYTSNGLTYTAFGSSSGKRYRTQMSALQVKVMKHLFENYKTPSMVECELLGQEIALPKRVVQVWFQNARAKEKKAKLNSGKLVNPETDFVKVPEECKLCSCKYSHKVTVQDHIFTKAHIDRIKSVLNYQGGHDAEPHNSSIPGMSGSQGDNSFKILEKESPRKDKKSNAMNSEHKQQHPQAVMDRSVNTQMLSALGGYMSGLDPSYLPFMYGGLPGYFPMMRFPMIQPGIIPDQMMAYDSLAFGTPLALLQIPAAAIKSVSDKLTEAGAVLARYTQDCQALADLHMMVSSADLTVAAEATLDVGYICKKCQMVFPMRESCVIHQHSVCLANSASLPKGFEPIVKLEQVQYECRACKKRYSTILEFKSHCQQESHKKGLIKFKVKEAARCETAGSPSSSAPYTLSSVKVVPSFPSSSSKPRTASPLNINNNSSNHNHNQVMAADFTQDKKSIFLPSSANQYNKISPTS